MEAGDCRSIAQLSSLCEETFTLPVPKQESVIGLLYLRAVRLTIQGGTSALLCSFHCERAEELLTRYRQTHNAAENLRQRAEMKRLLGQLDALSPTVGQNPLAEPAAWLLTLLLGQQPEGAEIPVYLRRVRQLIEQRYAEDLTLESLAAQVGRSKFHLSHAFRMYYQMTPGAYLTAVRLSRAAELLVDSDLPVREIGRRVGIPNSTYFTSLFKQRYGRPPREYRFVERTTEK